MSRRENSDNLSTYRDSLIGCAGESVEEIVEEAEMVIRKVPEDHRNDPGLFGHIILSITIARLMIALEGKNDD